MQNSTSKLGALPEVFKRFLRRNWEVFVFIIIAYLLLASLDLSDATSDRDSPYPLVRNSISLLTAFHANIVPITSSIGIAGALSHILLPLSVRQRRFVIDVFGVYASIRVLSLFALINILVFLKGQDHVMLILQLLVFLPCLLLLWGWIYWRLDAKHLIHTGVGMFSLKTSSGSAPTVYDYFLASFTSLLSHTLSGFSGETRTARTLIFIHGIMMWDVMGITLSRAISMISA